MPQCGTTTQILENVKHLCIRGVVETPIDSSAKSNANDNVADLEAEVSLFKIIVNIVKGRYCEHFKFSKTEDKLHFFLCQDNFDNIADHSESNV